VGKKSNSRSPVSRRDFMAVTGFALFSTEAFSQATKPITPAPAAAPAVKAPGAPAAAAPAAPATAAAPAQPQVQPTAKRPVKVGLSMSQSGPLGGGGKPALLALEMWRDDVNAKGGLLGRPVELVVYDDTSDPKKVLDLYTKLIDVDRVDLLIAPYGTNTTAPIMPMIKKRKLMLMGNFSFEINENIQNDMWFNNAPWKDAVSWGQGFIDLGKARGAKTIAFIGADAEFSQNLIGGAKSLARHSGLKQVYDKVYPTNNTDFKAILTELKASAPDIVFVASYPGESAAIVRTLSEVGSAENTIIFGGGMVGLQFAPIMQALGSKLNGVTNFASYVPGKSLTTPELAKFFERYSVKAKELKIDPLGYYLPPFNYAAGQMLEQAIAATNSLDHKALARYIRANEMKTIVGPIKYGRAGEWKEARLYMTQFTGIKDGGDAEQFRDPAKMVLVHPERLKTGELRHPFNAARS